uniref:Uncharacterized protein n=1 Tax=Haptolina brevifila TaxID=156173 RepID=A0A7S2JNJ7_9EUKA
MDPACELLFARDELRVLARRARVEVSLCNVDAHGALIDKVIDLIWPSAGSRLRPALRVSSVMAAIEGDVHKTKALVEKVAHHLPYQGRAPRLILDDPTCANC